jgi:putative transposase
MGRKKHGKELKARIALDAIKGQKTISELASEYGVHANQISRWKKQLLDAAPDAFSRGKDKEAERKEVERDRLYKKVGQLQIEVDWLKKKDRLSGMSVEEKVKCIDPQDSDLSISRQCDLLRLPRSSYYRPKAFTFESSENLALMRLIDEEFLRHPFYGSRKMRDYLNRQGFSVNRKRVQRLMQLMGIESVAPKPNTSRPRRDHKVYPYLLKKLSITKPDQVWCSDITYIRLGHGFVYLTAVMDWASRYVLSWEVSITMDDDFCVNALQSALRRHNSPEIFNTDQGSQYTGDAFTGVLKKRGIKISMDGKGRCMDNIFIERLWRSVKYEKIFLEEFETVRELITGLKEYFEFYNYERPHQSFSGKTPAEVYWGEGVAKMAA